MTWQRLLPTAVSIGIILLVTFLRERSRSLAAIIAVTPVNIPLALWVVSTSVGNDATAMANFARGLLVGLIPALIWLTVVYLTLRAGWSLLPAIATSYVAWGVLIGIGYAVGWLALDG